MQRRAGARDSRLVGGVGLVDSTIDVEMPGTAQRLLKVL